MNHEHNEPRSSEDEEPAGAASRARVPAARAQRHDGFTPKRRRKFLKTLRKTGCVRDACRAAKISDSAAYKARIRDGGFRTLWFAALSKAGGDIETLAWQHAVDGVEEEVWSYGKKVGVRRKRDPQLFRMLLQASNPARYGGQGLGNRKALEKKIRRQIEAEQEAEWQEEDAATEELRARIARKIERLRERMIRDGEAYRDEEGRIIPAGYVRAPDAASPDGSPDASDENCPELPDDESGAEAAQSGAEWTDPELPEAPSGGCSDGKEWRYSAEFPPPGPRITPL